MTRHDSSMPEGESSQDRDDTYDHFLLRAVREGDLSGVGYALGHGAAASAQDAEGMTALHHAAAMGARVCVRMLMASGRCDYLAVDHHGRYASQLASEWGNDHALARLLRKKQRDQADALGVPAWTPGESRG